MPTTINFKNVNRINMIVVFSGAIRVQYRREKQRKKRRKLKQSKVKKSDVYTHDNKEEEEEEEDEYVFLSGCHRHQISFYSRARYHQLNTNRDCEFFHRKQDQR
jgi:hypothetical protein